MHVKFLRTHGEVLIDMRKQKQSQMATPGLKLGPGEYVIATTAKSRAMLLVNGQKVELGPNSFLRVHGSKAAADAHREHYRGDMQLFLGRIWAKVARKKELTDTANAVVGVRG